MGRKRTLKTAIDVGTPCRLKAPTSPDAVPGNARLSIAARRNCQTTIEVKHMGGGGQPKNTTTTTETKLPAWLENDYQ